MFVVPDFLFLGIRYPFQDDAGASFASGQLTGQYDALF